MKKIITYENLRKFAYSNDHLIKGEIKGIVLQFSGLCVYRTYEEDTANGKEYAEKGVIYVIPYTNPWCWMNEQAVEYVDEIISVLQKRYGLSDSVKIVSTGESMGGLSSLVYTAYARITPVACVANCPVCDLVYHFSERDDLPRTIYDAFFHFDGSLEDAMQSRSPLHLVERMPDIEYTIFHCSEDKAVNIDKHSKRFVQAMKSKRRVDFIEVPLRGHCDLSPIAWIAYREAVLKAFE